MWQARERAQVYGFELAGAGFPGGEHWGRTLHGQIGVFELDNLERNEDGLPRPRERWTTALSWERF